MPVGIQVSAMSRTGKLESAMQRSLAYMPQGTRQAVSGLLTPASITIIAATFGVWFAAQFFGVGEIVDLTFLVVGVATLGFSVFQGAEELRDFGAIAVNANTPQDLDLAAKHFANAVVILGASFLQAVLLHGQGRAALVRGRPKIYGRMQVMGPPPPPGRGLIVLRPATLGGGAGRTDAWGVIEIARDKPLSEQRITLLHELAHRYFSPLTGPLRHLRAEVRTGGYSESAFLRYLEEALAEGYAQLHRNGFLAALKALHYPLAGGDKGYVTVSQLHAEGMLIGRIIIGGTLFYVSITHHW